MTLSCWHMLHAVATSVAIMSIVYGPTVIMAESATAAAAMMKTSSTSTAKTTKPQGEPPTLELATKAAEIHGSQAHKNIAIATTYANELRTYRQLQLQQRRDAHTDYGYDNGNSDNFATANKKPTTRALTPAAMRRSYGSSNNYNNNELVATLNRLTNLSGLQHISNGYDGATTVSAAIDVKRQIPIYEEQQEDDYGTTKATNSQPSGYVNGANHQPSNFNTNNSALRTAIYNLQTGGAHNSVFLPHYGYNRPLYSSASSTQQQHQQRQQHQQHQQHQQFQQHQQEQQEQHPIDKISSGNFLLHFERYSGYNEHQEQEQQQQQQRQQQHQQQEHQERSAWQEPQHPETLQHFSPHANSISGYIGANNDWNNADSTAWNEWQPLSNSADGSSGGGGDASAYEEPTNYLTAPPAQQLHTPPQQAPPDVINYVPYPVVKKLHVPYQEPVQIPVSQAVIVPVSKPVPIHIPVTQQVQVPVEKELKVPVERVVPFPVERHIPVPVEKHVPFPVMKYVPIKVPQPFPVKVPVFKTIVHKIKSWW